MVFIQPGPTNMELF